MIQDAYLPLDVLLPDTSNYNRHSPESITTLASQIVSVGFTAPFLVDAQTHLIAAGHRRRLALLKLRADNHSEPAGIQPGWLVPCRVGEWTEIQRLKVLVGDNPDPARLDYDTEQLTALLAELEKAGELEGSGYDEARLEALIGELAGEAGSGGSGSGLLPDADPDAVPEAVPARCKPDDLWALGENRILIADCRDASNWERLLGGRKANVVVTSPPYASQRKYDEESGFRPIPPDEYVEWFEAVQANIREHLAADGSFFLNIKEHCEDGQRHLYVKDLTLAHVRRWGWRFVDEFCWKHQGFPGEVFDRFRNAWEPIFHFAVADRCKCRPDNVAYESDLVIRYATETRESMTFDANHKGNAVREKGMAYPRNVLEVPNGAGTSIAGHAATFPVDLPSFFIRAFSDEGDVVVDTFMGSGTTLIAAENEGRRAFGFEISPKYGDVILARYESCTGKRAELLERVEGREEVGV